MAKFFRKVNRSRWSKIEPDSRISGDCFKDLGASDSTLSFWKFSDDESLKKIIVALAVSVENADKLDYVTVEESHIDNLSIEVRDVAGESPYPLANSLHVDLSCLSNRDIYDLSQVLADFGEFNRKPKREIVDMIKLYKSELEISRLKDGIAKLLEDEK